MNKHGDKKCKHNKSVSIIERTTTTPLEKKWGPTNLMLLVHCLLFAVFAARFNTKPQIVTRISISARLATRIPKRGTKKNANFCTTSNLSQSVSNGSPGHCGDLRATANHQHPQHRQQKHQKEGRQKPHFLFKGVDS